MHDLIDFISGNAALVVANPAPFATFAILFGGGGFAVGRYFLTERIANLESRIARRDEEIAELKGKQKAPEEEAPMVPILNAVWPQEPGGHPRLPATVSTSRKENLHVG
jgi:hypothetical protein